ncbi:hypothetical protein CesoFtcFv8_023810 [Champsocephalus esox]|uniref:Uncharacterized protein n=1 Tax=Champsocephalus esox TaxID=159716 RepID=A0AAN8B5J0_9TELE|nr:hypothetical protein CesoFtcFv8_023810 [Champsocephalus esox]
MFKRDGEVRSGEEEPIWGGEWRERSGKVGGGRPEGRAQEALNKAGRRRGGGSPTPPPPPGKRVSGR